MSMFEASKLGWHVVQSQDIQLVPALSYIETALPDLHVLDTFS